jgi:hypothetical protein
MTDFFDDLERELRRAHRRDSESHARSRVFDLRRLLPVLPAIGRPALVALAVVVALVAVVVTVARESEVERPAAPPGKKVVATDVERGVRFSLDGRVLTVQLLPPVRNQTFETVSGARISATCGANVAAPPGDPRSETTLTRLWPAGQTSLSYRFPRDISSWCRLDDQNGGIVAFVGFPGASPGARGPIAETAIKWARLIAASPETCNDYTGQTACEQITCQRVGGTPIPDCRPITLEWAVTFLNATVQATAISGDRAAATLSNGALVQLRRTATGEWLIDKLGEDGLPAELRRTLMRSGSLTD